MAERGSAEMKVYGGERLLEKRLLTGILAKKRRVRSLGFSARPFSGMPYLTAMKFVP